MNEQKPPKGIEWARVWGRRGFTWNPVGGCLHGCRWHMQSNNMFDDKVTAICYAEVIANKFRRAYPKGFEHIYWRPELLQEPLKLKEPAGIFLDSMSDLMGIGVKEEWVRQVLDVCKQTPQHIYFLLTKYVPNLLKFEFPSNVWVGVSSSPDIFMGTHMDSHRKHRYMEKALKTLSQVDVPVRWISFEPLNQDYSGWLQKYPDVIQWAVIGAASNGRKNYPPVLEDYLATEAELDRQSIPVFYKGNMNCLREAAMNWRQEFPYEPQISVA